MKIPYNLDGICATIAGDADVADEDEIAASLVEDADEGDEPFRNVL